MKKLLLTALMGTAIAQSDAQYFQSYKNLDFTIPVYRNERYNSGIKSNVDLQLGDPNKYYFTGVGVSFLDSTPMPVPGPVAYKGDRMRYVRNYRNGNVTHNRGYEVSNMGSSKVFNSEGNSIDEQTNAALVGRYYVVGSVKNSYLTSGGTVPGGSDASWFNLNNNGTINTAFRLDFNNGWFDRAMCVRESSLPGAAPTTVECGYTTPGTATAGRSDCYVTRRTNAGAILWAFTYNFDATIAIPGGPDADCRAFSICENPVTGNLYVVGIIRDNSVLAPQTDALAFALTPAGALLWARSYALGTSDRFHSVRFTTDGNLIVTGEANPPIAGAPPFNTWIAKLSVAGFGVPMFNNLIMIPAVGGIAPSRGWDIQERINTAGAPEYHIVGSVATTAAAPSQLWIKANAAGAGIQCNVYNTLGYDNFMGIDYVPGGAYRPGPAMFSSSRIPGALTSNSHLNHTYFNGAACINICPFPPTNMIVQPQHITMPCVTGTVFTTAQIKAKLFNYQFQLQCTQYPIGCGNNARELENIALNADEMSIYPNPANEQLNVTLTVYVEATYLFDIIDVTGKVIQSENVELSEGESAVQLNVEDLSQGVYILRVANGKQEMHKTFIRN